MVATDSGRERKKSLLAIVDETIAGEWFPYDRNDG